jgi:probable F420-dependent oxidoreductase
LKIDTLFPTTASVDTRAGAASAESAAYDGIWTSEVKHDPFVAVSLAAVSTGRIELGTGIVLAFARNPMSTAVQANDVQLVSGGRLLLGLGSQIKPHITRRFSMPWSHPAPRMREYILALRAIWECWNAETRLDFRGDFYTHTLMTPFFNPGPNPYGPPRVLLAGVGEVMTAVAGEVADGFLCHGFTTERYLREVTLPALAAGRAQAGADLAGYEVSGMPFVATGTTPEAMDTQIRRVREQIAFYGSTPAYLPVLERHGWGELGDALHQLSVQGRWNEMGTLIDDDMLSAFAVVGEPDRIAPALVHRFGDVMTRMTLFLPDEPELGREISADIRSATS